MAEGKFSLLNFYERRARRILPALFFVMLVSIPFAWLWLLPSDHKDFSQSLISVSVFSSNILFWLESGYFDAAAEMKPLLHTWSLAVEEQYYVLFPLFLFAVWTLRKRWIFGAILILGLISLLLAQWGAIHAPDFNFYMLPTRAWELMAGGLVSFYLHYGNNNSGQLKSYPLISEVLGSLGLLLILISLFLFNDKMPLPSLYTIMPVLGVMLVILFSSKTSIAGKILALQPLVGIGLISYSLYLWHKPILVFSRHRSLEIQSTFEIILLVALTFLFAFLSWQFVEKPFRNKRKINSKSILAFSVFGSLFFMFAGSLGHINNGFDKREFWFSNLLSYDFDNRKLQEKTWSYLRVISDDNEYKVTDNAYDKELWFDLSSDSKKLLIVGNSHSKDIFNILFNSDAATSRFQLARFGVQIRDLKDLDHHFYHSKNYIHSDTVLLATRFSEDDIASLTIVIKKLQADKKSVVIVNRIFDFDFNPIMYKNLADFKISELCRDTCDKSNAIEIVDNVNRAYFDNFKDPQQINSESQQINYDIERIASSLNVKVLDRMAYVCDNENERCFSMNNALQKYFYDYGHHTLEGAKFFAKRVDDISWLEAL